MKTMKTLFFSIAVCLMFASSTAAQQTAPAKKMYQNIVVEKFTIKEGVELQADKADALTNSVVKAFQKSKRFESVALASDTASNAGETPVLKVVGKVIKYGKGNRAARYIIGLGVGATRLFANIKFIDAKTGETVHEQAVDGVVTWGVFGGDSDGVNSDMANEIVKIAKKNFTNGQKIDKK